MMELSEQERRKRRRAGCTWGCGGAIALLALVAAGVTAYLGYANQIPTPSPVVVELPSPNARDDYLAAVALIPANERQVSTDLQEGKDVDLKGLVEAAQPALKKVRASFRYQHLNPPATSFTATFPELSEYRSIARLFAAEGRHAEKEGRLKDAVRSYLDCYRFGGEMQRGGVLIHGLVGVAVQAIALGPLDDLAPRLDEPTAVRAARELAVLQARSPGPADAFSGEAKFGELSAIEMMQQAGAPMKKLNQTTNGGEPQFDWDSTQWGVRYAFTPKKQMLANYRRLMAQYIAQAKKPYGQRGPDPPKPEDPLNEVILPVFSGAIFSWDRINAGARLVEGKLAARAYLLRHGRMPAKMEDVAPEIVPKTPLDWFGGKPLRIGPIEGKGSPVVYSLGPDLDDDKGRSVGQQMLQTSDGDLVEIRRRKRIAPKRGVGVSQSPAVR